MNLPGITNQNIKFSLYQYDKTEELIAEGLPREVLNILLQIENSYPFTFLEKENIRKKVDGLKQMFWIKDRKTECILVNQHLSTYFNTSFLQLEGSSEELFFPPEFQKTIKAFNEITYQTKKAICAEGLRFAEREGENQFTLINFPLIDREDTVIALISFSIARKEEKKRKIEENYSRIPSSLGWLPFASGILNLSGEVLDFNEKFKVFFGYNKQIVKNSSIFQYFSSTFGGIFDNFIHSDLNQKIIKSSILAEDGSSLILIILGKVFDENNNTASIFIGILNNVTDEFGDEQENSLNMIENLIRNNPDAVLVCEKENLKFLDVNDAALNLYGYKKEEFLQMDLTDLYSAEDIQLLLDSSSANVREGAFHGPYKHKRKDGTTIFVEMSRYRVKYQNHEAHFNVVRNITDRLETDRRNKSYKSAFENSDDLIFLTDSSGFIKSINHPVTKILGFTKNDMLNASFASYASDEERSQVNLSIFQSNKKEDFSISLHLKKIDGSLLPVDFIISPILDSNKETDSFTIIGKVKQSISTAGVNLRNESGDKESIDSVNSKFLADLFHELLTPINVIIGFAQEITDSIDNLTPEQKEAAEIIKQNRTNLLQSMNAAAEFAALSNPDSSFLTADTRITDIIDLLVKDVEDVKKTFNVEFAYGKISSSLKFETDRQRFKYFLSLLFRTIAQVSEQKKIYFSAYAQDQETFLITFRDLHTHSSKKLINNLKNIFLGEGSSLIQELGSSKIFISLIQKLFNLLKGKFVLLNDGDKSDYGIVFPIKYSSAAPKEISLTQDQEEISQRSIPPIPSESRVVKSAVKDIVEPLSVKEEAKAADKAKSELINELKMEALREKIKKKVEEKKSQRVTEKGEETYSDEHKEELVTETIEFIDVDLGESIDEQIEEEIIEIIETSAPKKKIVETVKANQTDEKVDISNLSCLYFEDQIDSQILFRLQMKGLKKLDFAVSFEESLPLLDSGEYDFIVIDINLQGSFNGLDILRIIRNMPKYENTPVFAVTAYVLPGDQQKFVLAGFSGFISKPIFRDQMIDVLAEVFNSTKQS